MEKMEQTFQLKCSKGNQAIFLCVNQKCSNSIVMCSIPLCECQLNHQYCMTLLHINKIKQNLELKGKKYIPFVTNIYNTYENLVKLLTVEMQECRRIIDQNKLYLVGKEKVLYQYLKEGKSESITLQLVKESVDSIFEEHQYDFIQCEKQIQSKSNQIKKIIDETKDIKDKHKNKPLVSKLNLKFQRSLCNSDISIYDNTIRSNSKEYQKIACIQIPSKLKLSNCKFTLKIKSLNFVPLFSPSSFMIGVCQLTSNININDSNIGDKIHYGALTYSQYSKVSLGSALGHKQESNNINSFEKGDIIEVLYEYVEKKVTVINSTKNTQSVSYIQIDKSIPLYLAISIKNQNDEIELLSIA